MATQNSATEIVRKAIEEAAAKHGCPAEYVRRNVRIGRGKLSRYGSRGTKVWGFRRRGFTGFPDDWREDDRTGFDRDWYAKRIEEMGRQLGEWWKQSVAHNANEAELTKVFGLAKVDPEDAAEHADAHSGGFQLEFNNLTAMQLKRLLKVARRCGAVKPAKEV